jgi:hypothetical protein
MDRIRSYLTQPISIAPLATFRVLFGVVMCVSVLRFMLKGWVTELYVKPGFYFSYYGFEWVKPLGGTGMHAVFVVMALAALGVALGAFYRVAAGTFFLTWTYVELLDVTNYLNHYYFVSIAAFLMVFLPAHRFGSVDAWRNPRIRVTEVPRWVVGAVRLQLGMVYFFAGLAKVQGDWLFRAQPLKIWLASKTHLPLIGWMFKYSWAAYAFSWFGCIYDLTVPFFLLWRRARPFAYAAVIGFHLITWWLFPIGMFPFIMILGTLVFFPGEWHERMWRLGARGKGQGASQFVGQLTGSIDGLGGGKGDAVLEGGRPVLAFWKPRVALVALLAVHFTVQALMPMRYLLYPENLFWHEQGFRFSWRVMLMEKAGYAIFHVRDPQTGRKTEVRNADYLLPNQERMMATQPDLILQFAHFLEGEYQRQGIADPEVYAEVYATLNGSGSRPFTDPTVDLTRRYEGFAPKDWILPFEGSAPTYSQEVRP